MSPTVAKMLIELQQIRKLADTLEKEITMNFDEWISTDTTESNMDDFNEHASFDSTIDDNEGCQFCGAPTLDSYDDDSAYGWCCTDAYKAAGLE